MIDEIKNSSSRQEDMHTAFMLWHTEVSTCNFTASLRYLLNHITNTFFQYIVLRVNQSNFRTLELTRTTCGVLLKFLNSIKGHAFSISQAVKDSKEFTRQELYGLEMKFEVLLSLSLKRIKDVIIFLLTS